MRTTQIFEEEQLVTNDYQTGFDELAKELADDFARDEYISLYDAAFLEAVEDKTR